MLEMLENARIVIKKRLENARKNARASPFWPLFRLKLEASFGTFSE